LFLYYSAVATDAVDAFYGPFRWSDKAQRLTELAMETDDPHVHGYATTAHKIARLTWEPGDLEIGPTVEGPWKPFGDPNQQPYGLLVRDQGGGLGILEEIGAIQEIHNAVTGHCEECRPSPPYAPESLKARLEGLGWSREQRVAPHTSSLDHLPVNERFDSMKFFQDGKVGVGVEIEKWDINNDLLKFWRSYTRGQIAVGVIIHPDPATLRYCFDQKRILTAPLLGTLPVVFIAPDGEGLAQHYEAKTPTYGPFPMPTNE
jgi:hypothetical protein